MSGGITRRRTLSAAGAIVVLVTVAVVLVGLQQPAVGIQSADLTLVDSTAPGAETDHSWSIQLNSTAPDRQLDSVTLNYSNTGVSINSGNLSTSSVSVSIGGTAVGLSSVSSPSPGVLEVNLTTIQTVTGGETITVSTDTGNPAFTNPSTVGNYEAEIRLTGDTFDPATATFTVGTGFEGTVTDNTGTGLQDVTVTVVETGDSTQTDASGNYSLAVPAGSDYTLRLEKTNYVRTDYLNLSLSENQVTNISPSLAGRISVSSQSLSDRSPNATGVEYSVGFSVDAPVTNVSYVSMNLSDAAPQGLSTDGVTDSNLTFLVNGTEIPTSLASTQGDPEVILNLSTEHDFLGPENLTIRVDNVTNPDSTGSPYLLGVGLHVDSEGSPGFAKSVTGAQFEIGVAETRVRKLTIPAQDRSIIADTPRHTNTFDTSASNIQSLAAGPATQTLSVTLDEAGSGTEQQLAFDLNDTDGVGLDVNLVGVSSPTSEISIVSASLDDSTEMLTVNYTASAAVTNATITVDIELTANETLVPFGVATHVVSGPNGYVEAASYRAEVDGATGIADSDATLQTFLGQTTTITPTIDGTNGAFRLWQNQTVTFQQSTVGQNITIYAAQQSETGAWQLGPEVRQANTFPGAISGYRATLPAGKYFVTFEGTSDAVYLQVDPLNLTTNFSSAAVSATETTTLNVTSADPGGSVAVAIIDQNETVHYSQQVTLDDTGNASLSINPSVDLNGTGEYAALVFHNESELRAFDQLLVEPSTVSGSVTLESPIDASQSSFGVDYNFTNTTNGDAYLVVENLDTGGVVSQVVTSNGTLDINVTSFEGIQAGDTIAATLWESDSLSTQLGVDSVTVDGTGTPFFEAEITNAPSSVESGETITVDAAITNTGDAGDTQTVTFSVVDETGTTRFEDTRSVELPAGESTSLSFEFTPEESGDLTVRVETENTSDAVTVAVESGGRPAISVTPRSLSFGEVPVGESATLELSITNTGSAPLELRSVSVIEGSQWFDASGGGTLEEGASTTVSVTFTPEESGSKSGRIVVQSNDPSNPALTVQLSGTGVEGDLTVSPSAVSFGDVSIDETRTETITLSNDGDAPVTVTSVTVTGADSAAFAANVRGVTLDGGESRDVQVSFSPSEERAFQGTLLVRTQGGSSTSVSLSGTGVEKRLNVSPRSLDFGDVTVEETRTRTITISNPTESEVSISGVQITSGETAAFTISGAQSTLGPEESTTVQITFRPGERRNYTATVGVFGPEGDLQGAVALSGTGTAGELQVSPGTLSFGDVTAGQSVSRSVTISNVGDEAITVQSVRLEGDDAFRLSDGAGSLRLGPDASRTLTVTFTPTENGSSSAYLQITSDAAVSPTQVVSLTSGRVSSRATAGENETNTTITIANATAGEAVSVSVANPTDDDQFQVNNLSITPVESGDIQLNVTTGTSTLASTPDAPFPADNTTQLGNLSIDASVDNDAIESVTFTYRVSVAELNARGTSPEDVALFRYDEERELWVEQDTELVGIRNGQAILQTTGDGFSDWTAAAKRPELGITDTEIDIRAATTEEEITIQVFVTNTGGADGGYEAQLISNDEVIEREDATVPANSTVIINFVRTFDQPNVYEIRVNDVPVGEVEITEDEEVVVSTPTPDDDPAGGDGDGEQSDDGGSADDDGGGALDGLGPGFGVPVAVLALVVASYLAVRRRESGRL